MNSQEKELTPEEAEDILADRLAHLFIEQIKRENERKNQSI